MNESGLINLNKQIGEAELRRDETFLRDVLADELVFRRASGAVVTKEEYLAELIKPENTYEYLESENLRFIANEEIAVVTLIVKAKGKRGEKEFEGKFQNRRVFIEQQGNWKCIVWFNTKIS